MADERSRTARAELQAWYIHTLLPKLTRATKAGVVNPQALDALDHDVRALLDLSRVQERVA
jgi:hypothetical protein